jgi:hypothetical protein
VPPLLEEEGEKEATGWFDYTAPTVNFHEPAAGSHLLQI